MKFAVSTTAFRGKTLVEIESLAKQHELVLEFSSGLPHDPGLKEFFIHSKVPRLPHNYFPAPKDPFVLNLASRDRTILKRSIEHARQGLELAAKAGSPFYSVHAGFCFDPKGDQLGATLEVPKKFDREFYWSNFINSIYELTEFAEKLGVRFLIENNVLARFNYKSGLNPLLCVEPQEMVRLVKEINHPVLGILLDTAHLKVSAHTLSFDLHSAVALVAPYIGAVHHSDNDGKTDSNEPIDSSYWFLPLMSAFQEIVHVLEVHDQTPIQVKEQFALLSLRKKAA